jgi:hypothetical protein
LISVAGGLTALSLYNHYLGAFGVCAFLAYFFHVNMVSAGDGHTRVGELLNMSAHGLTAAGKSDDAGHGQYV